GIIDLITMKARMFNDETLGATFEDVEIPASLKEQALEYRHKLLEAVADVDDTLLEKFLEGKEISEKEITAVLRKATIEVKIIPVLCGSSFKNKGVQNLLDKVIDLLPSPSDVGDVEGHHYHTG